ncbi:MAG: ribonuclease HII [Bacteroidota bacterium]
MLLPFFSNQFSNEAGCDEAGRGCLAGPVVAGAVILPKDYTNGVLNDSKKLDLKTRQKLRVEIEREAVTWGVGFVSPEEIDKINILNASFLAMERAVKQLNNMPDLLLIDGNRFKTSLDVPFECIIKGDGKYMSIAAASVLAKTYRDDYMKKLAKDFSEYGWETNVGYPTAVHRNAIAKFGATMHHRRSFQLLPRQMNLF